MENRKYLSRTSIKYSLSLRFRRPTNLMLQRFCKSVAGPTWIWSRSNVCNNNPKHFTLNLHLLTKKLPYTVPSSTFRYGHISLHHLTKTHKNKHLVKNCEFLFEINALIINLYQFVAVSGLPAETSLNTYIRDHAGLTGTKFMCKEGGCGACVVSLEFTHPATAQERTVSVNSVSIIKDN